MGTRELAVEDVVELVRQAQSVAGSDDPAGVVAGIVRGLGEQVTVSGDVLRAGLERGGIAVPAEAREILGRVASVKRDKEMVRIDLGQQISPVVRGTQLRLGPDISFAVQNFPDGVALADIQNISVNKFIWIDVQRLQFRDSGGKKSVRVDTNFGGKEFSL